MFITDKKLKEMVRSILTEVAYSEPFAGNIAYFIVNFLAADRLKKYIAPRHHQRVPLSMISGMELYKFNFLETFDRNSRRAKAAFLPLTDRELKYATGAPAAISMFNSHHNNVKNGFEFIKQKLESDVSREEKKKSRQKMLDMWSGVLRVNIETGSGENELLAAYYNTSDFSLQIEIKLNDDFMTFGLTRGKEIAYSEYSALMDDIKHVMVHELTHSSQKATGFTKKELLPGENEIQKHIRSNYFGYSDIDPVFFPKISELQNFLKDEMLTFYNKMANELGNDETYEHFSNMRQRHNYKLSPKRMISMYFYSRLLAQLFSPEEVEAYARGYRSRIKSQLYQSGLTKKGIGSGDFYDKVEQDLVEKLDARFDEFAMTGLKDLDLSNGPGFTFEEYKSDMIEGYMKSYKSIFG